MGTTLSAQTSIAVLRATLTLCRAGSARTKTNLPPRSRRPPARKSPGSASRFASSCRPCLRCKKSGTQNKIKPPDRIGHELADHKSPGLPIGKSSNPSELPGRFRRIAANVGELGLEQARVLFRLPVEPAAKTSATQIQAHPSIRRPSANPSERDPGHDKRRHNGPDVCAGVKNAGGQCPLFLREPFRNALDAGGKNARLAESER